MDAAASASASEDGNNFVLISEDVSELEASVLGDDVLGEPLNYQDNNLGECLSRFENDVFTCFDLDYLGYHVWSV